MFCCFYLQTLVIWYSCDAIWQTSTSTPDNRHQSTVLKYRISQHHIAVQWHYEMVGLAHNYLSTFTYMLYFDWLKLSGLFSLNCQLFYPGDNDESFYSSSSFQIYPGENNRLEGVKSHFYKRIAVFLKQCYNLE